jgi:hypothetical protein
MIELVLQIKDGKGGFKTHYKSFNSGGAAYAWYNQQPNHSVDKELDSAYHRDNPKPPKKKKIVKPKSE